MTIELNGANFESQILQSNKLCVVDFWAEWCGPCRAVSPIIEELANEYVGQVNIGKLNVDKNAETSIKYGISSIPAILFFKNGKVVDKQIGAVPKAALQKKIMHNL